MLNKRLKLLFLWISVLFACLTLSGFTADFSLMNDGKGSAELTVNKQNVSGYAQNITEFREFFQRYLDRLNSESGDDDFFIIKSCTETADDYIVTVKTRRVDKLKGLGSLGCGSGKYYTSISGNLTALKEYSEGTVRGQFSRVYPDNTSNTWRLIRLSRGENNLRIRPVEAVTGDAVAWKEFSDYLENTDDKILAFNLIDLSFVDKITLQFNGKIKYFSSECVTLKSDNTVEITPLRLNASVEGEPLSVDAMIGYIVYSQNISGGALAAIIAGALIIGGFVAVAVRRKWFQQFFRSRTWKKIVKYRSMYVLLLPGLTLLIIFHYVPMIGLKTAFQEYNLLEGGGSEWVGMKYFSRIFFANTDRMYRIFRNTIYISLIRILTNFPVILMFALLVNSIAHRRLRFLFQTVSFAPYFLSWAAVAGLLYAMISDFGLVNTLMVKLGFDRVSYYGEINAWWGLLALSSLWKGMGWGTLIYIAAMCNIDNELYEASALDGCGKLKQMFTVTLPGIMPMICLQLILDASGLLKDNYEQILALLNGSTSVKETTEVIGQVTFDALRSGKGFGSATAMGMIQGVIGLILVFVTNKIVKKSDNQGII